MIKFNGHPVEQKRNFLSDTTKQVYTHSSEFQVFIDNIMVKVPRDFNPAELTGLIKVLNQYDETYSDGVDHL